MSNWYYSILNRMNKQRHMNENVIAVTEQELRKRDATRARRT